MPSVSCQGCSLRIKEAVLYGAMPSARTHRRLPCPLTSLTACKVSGPGIVRSRDASLKRVFCRFQYVQMGVRTGSHSFLSDLHSISGSAVCSCPSNFLRTLPMDSPHAAPGPSPATGAGGMSMRLSGKGEAWLCHLWAAVP